MYILPYYIEKKESKELGCVMLTAWIFLSGDKLWKTDEEKLTKKQAIDTYLDPNGFKGSFKCVKGDTMYFEVDTVSTNMSEFYSWKDFLGSAERIPDIQLWRPFFLVKDLGTNDEFCWKGHPCLKDFWSNI